MRDRRLPSELARAAEEKVRQQIRDDGDGKSEDVARLLAAIEAHILDPAFDVNRLKRTCSPSDATLWLFRAETGRNLKAYLDDQRAALARRLVCKSDAKLRQIAERLGFIDAELFSKWFKRRWGKPPTKLRLEHPVRRCERVAITVARYEGPAVGSSRC